jgi:hypothetical protein
MVRIKDTQPFGRSHGSTQQVTFLGRVDIQVQIFLSEPVLASCRDLSPAVQQHRLNAYVNGQYLSLDVDTSQERDLLRTTVAPAEWLRIFDTYHAVKLKALGLPRAW